MEPTNVMNKYEYKYKKCNIIFELHWNKKNMNMVKSTITPFGCYRI